MVAPVLLAFGTEEQKQRWLPAIRDGSDYWCQGYSEPGSGSDLASLQCKAVRDGDHYIINGTKIWTTHAQWANKMFCLVRTSSSGKAQQGISFLLFDLPLPGITIRPIISLSGDHELNQVFFDDVRVPASALLGEEDRGWTIAKYLLVHERGGTWAPMLRARLLRLHAAAASALAGRPASDDERRDIARQLADAECRVDALHALEQQVLAARIRGIESPVAPSVGKLLGTELKQFITEIGVGIAGVYGAARLPMADCADHALAMPEDAVFAMSSYLNDRAASIYAGTNEVQRNLIAQHLLAH
jgi:acyl-CoA dehydrogenase